MKKAIILPFFLLFFSFLGAKTAFAQAHHSAVSVKLLFASDKHQLTAEHIAQLDSAWRIVEKMPLTSVVVDGNTDSDGSEKYNEKLSKRRSEAVKTYLATKNIEDFMLKTDFWGETRPIDDNATNKGKRENRRVEVFFFYSTPPPLAQNPVKSVEKQVVKPDPVAVIPPPQKSKETPKETPIFSKKIQELPCKVEADPGCAVYEIIGDSAVLSELSSFKTFCSCSVMAINGLFTYSSKGEPLLSGGMFEFTTKNGKCLPKPIEILVPFKEYDKNMTLWDIDSLGNWTVSTDPLDVIYKNGQGYWKITTSCGGKKNFDKRCTYEKITVALNSRQGLRLSIVQAYYSIGNLAGFYGEKNIKQTNLEFAIPYDSLHRSIDKIQLYVVAKNKKGESFILKNKAISKYTYPLATRTYVKQTEKLNLSRGVNILRKKLFGFLPIYKKGSKWLYILDEKDFEKQPTAELSEAEKKTRKTGT